MASNVEIYNLLNKVKVSEVTQSQLQEMTSRTAIDKDAIEFWSGVITVARAIGESRTFAHGLPIYDSGAVIGSEIADGATATYTPTGTEVWYVQNIDIQGTVCALRDGDGNLSLVTADTFKAPFYMSSTMSIFFNNGSGSAKTPTIAYTKVSL